MAPVSTYIHPYRDVDLHTFWGSSALRVAAYVIKRDTSPGGDGGAGSSTAAAAAAAAAAPHLQSQLDYVFCLQV